MKTKRMLMLIGTIGLGLVQAGAELPAPSPVSPGAASGPLPGPGYRTPLAGKLYVGFDLCAALQNDITLSDTAGDSERVTFDPGPRFDLQLGYNLAKNWAAELELGFIVSPVKYSYAFGSGNSVALVEVPVMVNVIYSRPLWGHCSAYVGGGAGGVFINYQDAFGNTTPAATTFGYQGMAGLKYVFGPKWDMGIGYKVLGTTGYNVGSGVAYDGYTPTEYKSDGNFTQAILLTFNCKF